MNKQTSPTVGRASPAAGLKTIGLVLAAILGLSLLVPLGMWFVAQHLKARRKKSCAKQAFIESTAAKVVGS